MADLTVAILTRILQRIGASASEVDELVAAIDETKVYATEVALLAATPADGTIGYAENTDNYWFRRNGAWTTQGSAGEVLSVVSKTANYTATGNDHTILVDATSGAVTITLPAAATNSGREYVVKKIDSGANAVTVDANAAETIDGAATYVLSEQWETITIQCNGTAWFAVAREKRVPQVAKTASYTATANDHTILVDATSGAATITLPAAASHANRMFAIKKTDASANAVTVDGNASETIDGATTVVLSERYENITIQSDGSNWHSLSQGRREPVVAKTAAYTATANDRTILCDATGGAFSVTLPAAASNTGRVYNIKKTDAGANDVTIDGAGAETIDGAATLVLNAQYDVAIIQCDGTAWHVLSKIITP